LENKVQQRTVRYLNNNVNLHDGRPEIKEFKMWWRRPMDEEFS
jgi:hypothetical protein